MPHSFGSHIPVCKFVTGFAKMYLSTHLTHWQTKCCNNGLVLVINLLLCHNVAKYCSFKHEKSQTIVCNDLKVMSFQTSKMDQILCMKKYLLQIQSLIMITEVHMLQRPCTIYHSIKTHGSVSCSPRSQCATS